jgi:hypothetical protein
MKKYYRLIESDSNNEGRQFHMFIEIPETKEEIKLFDSFKGLVDKLSYLNYEEEYGEEEADKSRFSFALNPETDQLMIFESYIADILIEDQEYSNNVHSKNKIDNVILDFKETNIQEIQSAMECGIFLNHA